MKYTIRFILVSVVIMISFMPVSEVFAGTIIKNETRDVVGNYGTMNVDSDYFPHTRIPHPNSGTSDGMIKTIDVDIYPGSGAGDFYTITLLEIDIHDHDDSMDFEVLAHTEGDEWVSIASAIDISTRGSDALCGKESLMYGLYNHPHDDSVCYKREKVEINARVDQVLLRLSCKQSSSGCPRDDEIHIHIDDIIWHTTDPDTPTPVPPTPTNTPGPVSPTNIVQIACGNVLVECANDAQCGAPGSCVDYGGLKLCRNTACVNDNDCDCSTPPETPTPTPTIASYTQNAYCPF